MSSTDEFLLSLLSPSFNHIEAAIDSDDEFKASAAKTTVKFGIVSSDSDQTLLVDIQKDVACLSSGIVSDASFCLSARPDDWTKFFQRVPPRPHQSYWGILRVLGHEDGVSVEGDLVSFARNARLWRLVLERIRDALHQGGAPTSTSAAKATTDVENGEEDNESTIVGRYTTVTTRTWGRSRVFYETSGSGPQHVLFLHTAGADSRQFHALMDNPSLQERCTMYAFDLPGHGRSYPGDKMLPQGFVNTEDDYVECIGKMIHKLKLIKPIVSGASMAGHICLAVAICAAELGVGGVIPCEGCEHLPVTQPIYELPGDVDEAMLNPERVCGMIAPGAPEANKRLIWWIYSSQAIQMFAGDLRFYFQGWDGRGRVETIDTEVCPVYMLTGEYDYSCTAEASEETAKKIKGAVFEKMQGLGHFPMTEDPKRFLSYFIRALDFIEAQNSKRGR